MAAAITITPPSSSDLSATQTFTIAATGLANNSTAYNFLVTDPSGAIASLPFTSNGSGASPNVVYVPTAPGTMTVKVQVAALPAAEATQTQSVSSQN